MKSTETNCWTKTHTECMHFSPHVGAKMYAFCCFSAFVSKVAIQAISFWYSNHQTYEQHDLRNTWSQLITNSLTPKVHPIE